MISALQTHDDIEDSKDTLGGYTPLESDVYDFTIEEAYTFLSSKKAYGLNLTVSCDAGSLNQTLYLTSGEDKGQVNYTESNGVKKYFAAFTMANDIALLTCAEDIGTLYANTTKKIIKKYDYDTQRDEDVEVDMIVPLVGKKFKGGVKQTIEDKTKPDATGAYRPTGETYTKVTLDKVFRLKDGMTVNEIKGKEAEASFITRWLDKNKGVTLNRSKGTSGASAPNGKAGAPLSGGGTKTATKSLFS